MRITERGASRTADRSKARLPFHEAIGVAARRLGSAPPRAATRAPGTDRLDEADRRAPGPHRGGDGPGAPQHAPAPHAPPVAYTTAAEPEATPLLRALVRALPVAVEASALGAGATLALAFGRSLDVELRAAPRGVELVLRADRRLASACADGLPAIVAALARRGVAVARAEVRPRAAPPGRCVDLPAALR